MRKRRLKTALTVASAAFALTALGGCAKTLDVNERFEYTLLEDGSYEVGLNKKFLGVDWFDDLIGNCVTEIIIPEEYDGKPVTAIADGGFEYCRRATKLELPNTVTRIGARAFVGCESLTDVLLSDCLISIGTVSFSGCDGLTDIEFPDSLVSIEDSAFWGCGGIVNISLPQSLTELGSYAFCCCGNLERAELSEAVTSIGERVFYLCYNLTDISVDEDNSTYTDADGNLYNKDGSILIQYAIGKKNTEFVVPASVTQIAQDAFGDCKYLEKVEMGDSVTRIEKYAFYGCENLTGVTIGNGISNIGSNAFYGCERLVFNELGAFRYLGNSENPYLALISVLEESDGVGSIHKSTRVIAGNALHAEHRLRTVVIPVSVVSIGDDALSSSIGPIGMLYDIFYEGTPSEWLAIEIGKGNNALDGSTLYYYSESEPSAGNYWHYVDGEPTAWWQVD